MKISNDGDIDVAKVLITPDRLQQRVSELALQISQDFSETGVALVAILRGSFVFAADLIRYITIPVYVDFMSISSYGSQTGIVRITKDLDESIRGRHVLMVEDIIDTGLTASYLIQNLRRREPASIEICALLDKSARRIIDLPIKYSGFDIPDVFVVGYGMDYRQRFRNLPYIGVLAL
ncbi:MAG TPA: hypoxanthine phosphoribosyltransferase [Blastocatellia bacterium]|nr:hypoxanthine phosphoribosyltransferase [Blastocatellia bacterium]